MNACLNMDAVMKFAIRNIGIQEFCGDTVVLGAIVKIERGA